MLLTLGALGVENGVHNEDKNVRGRGVDKEEV